MNKFILLLPVAASLVLCAQTMSKLNYPGAPKGDQVDDYHGTRIADPYRTLENADAPATQKWVEEENALTFAYLGRLPGRAAIKSRLTQLWDYEKFSGLEKAGTNYFYFRNSGLQNQSVLYVMDSLNGSPKELLDPNTYRADGTVALDGTSPSWNGKMLAYSVAQAGSDWTEWKIRDVAAGKDLPDKIQWTKSTSFAWTKDNRGFYYSRYPEPPPDKLLTVAAENQKVYFHKLGDPQTADKLIYERPDHPVWELSANTTEDGNYLIFTIAPGDFGKSLLFYEDLRTADPKVIDLVKEVKYRYEPIETVGSTLYVLTTDGASRGRVIAMDLKHPEPANWKVIVPEKPETLDGVRMADGKLVLTYTKDAHSSAEMVEMDGKPVREIAMPGIGTAYWSPARKDDHELFYLFASYTAPPIYYRFDLGTGESTIFRKSKVDFNAAAYETKQVFYHSKDGTRVPMFITCKRGMKLDGMNPALLYAYGGFNVSLTPSFSPAIAAWLEMGGVYAVANLRGGSEYGEAWHLAGTKHNKQNVFDDFIAAAEWLISNKYTSTPKLAIFGGSNGGLLIGAVLNQRPDLFGAAMPAVGVMDMLRFQKFGYGASWAGDYGSSDDPEDFKAIRAYSPLHNIHQGANYPPTLITTSDHDDRVMPGHSLKYAATLQDAQGGPAPILIRIETRAGHGAGKPTTKLIDEWVDRFAFLQNALGMHTGS